MSNSRKKMSNSGSLASPTPMAALTVLRWHVFLSFRGEDTRDTVTSRLYSFLKEKRVRVFLDNDGLDRGDEIAPCLLEAIDDSAAFIIIVSPNYASSHWCLEEMARICELGRLILPVFYRVDPSDVQRQMGPFEQDFEKHSSRFGEVQVEKWRKAMEKVGGIAGWVFNKSDDKELVESLAKRVVHELSNNVVATYSVGIDSRAEELIKLLNAKATGIQILGLHGIGGVGKTTLAKALYNRLVGKFEYRSFISDVSEQHQISGLESLQNKLISNLTRGQSPLISEVHTGISAIKGIVYDKQVLIVLDDVDKVTQLEALAGKREWFNEGSRIIITTRDRQILRENYVNLIYEVRELNSSQALQLFSYHALRREKPTYNFFNLSEQIVSLAGGLPLALEVIGSFLSDKKTIKEWEDSLKKLRNIRPACLFVKIDMNREDVVDIMKGCGFEAEISISVLTAKSLVKIAEDDSFWMHDQLRDMGRQIDREQNLVDPGMRSRLWDRDEILTLLENNKGTRSIQGIVLDFKKNFVKDPGGVTISWNNLLRRPNIASAVTYLKEVFKKCQDEENEKQVVLYTKPFRPMVNLRLLEINQVKLVGNFKYVPTELRWLQWKGCPLRNLPYNFHPRQLTVLDLSESNIKRVWGWNAKKVAENLMVLNLKGCRNLDYIDLSGHQNLEKLVLQQCSKITNLHKSIGSLSTLLFLNLKDCINLVDFPSDVSGLKNLETLILSGCSGLKELPKTMGHMRSLKELLLDKTAIATLPESIFRLTNLEKLNLNGCRFLKRFPNCIGALVSLRELTLSDTALEELPHSVGDLVNLEKLNLMQCKSLAEVPDNIGNLKSLTEFLIDASAIRELPSSIGSLSFLKILSAENCEFLSRLPDSIEGLASTVELQFGGPLIAALPENMGSLKTLRKIEMRNCTLLRSLPATIGGILTLTTLTIDNVSIMELPESIGLLENLVILQLNKCKMLNKLPSSMGNLKSLHHFGMDETAVIEIPESLGMLSRLMVLRMTKRPLFRLPNNSEPADSDTVERPTLVPLPTSLSNLSLLEELDAHAFGISGRIPDEFEKLSSLEILNLGNNDFCSLPCSLRGLSLLKKLYLPYCENLKSLPPIPSSLLELNLANCFALESVSDLSNLENLHDLNLTNCEKVVDIPGLECLKSLERLYLSGCKACFSAVKRRLSKVCLKDIHNLSMPGSKIPDWFSQGRLRFSQHKDLEVKSVIIGVVVSLDHQITDELRNKLPAVMDIQANILKLGEPVYTFTLQLMGVPRTHDDQVHFYRYPHFHQLDSQLNDDYEIEVTKRDPQEVKGVELKMSGAHLVFENDDDCDGNEELLDESQNPVYPVSERLANFFSSIHEQDD
ncbi:disease resistance protein RPV1-like isoform X2 [Tripterygium wilfordii]|uniref:disease resistance protein RPV1-like isoform X2 n=1 Tax=Tripterygium wilfordii TaxID=458696 RepID=UPI0018F82A42|nr:disease resistance protein RPV1-like isoform X2 [Tripterygium wilfordii]